MRVAVYPDSDKQGTPFAYKLGRIVDGQHNHNIVTGETTPIEDVIKGLVEQANGEFPDATVVVEQLHDNGDGTSSWRSIDEEATPVENAGVHEVELSASQESQTPLEGNV